MVVRSDSALAAVAVFHRSYNDLDVYVEDTAVGSEKLHETILEKSLEGKFKISKVIPLGGRGKVINAAKNPPNDNRKKIYLIDGDLHLLCGEKEVLPTNIVTLSSYCIENFLLDCDGVVEVMHDEDAEFNREHLRNLLNYEGWKNDNCEALTELYICFAVAHSLGSAQETVKISKDKFTLNGGGVVDKCKVNEFVVNFYKNLISEFSENEVHEEKNRILAGVDAGACFLEKYVSGKNMLFPLLLNRISSVMKFNAQPVSVRNRIVKYGNSKRFGELGAAIFSQMN